MSSILQSVISEIIESKDIKVYGSVSKKEHNNFWAQTNAIESAKNIGDIAKEILKMRKIDYNSEITQRSLLDRALKKAMFLGFECKSRTLDKCIEDIVSSVYGTQTSLGFE